MNGNQMARRPAPDVFAAACPSRAILSKVANKWTLLIIDALDGQPLRNGELIRKVQGISQKMLTQCLRELEELRLIIRHDRKTVPPHVEYELTRLGRSLRAQVCQLDRWIETHMRKILPLDGPDASGPSRNEETT